MSSTNAQSKQKVYYTSYATSLATGILGLVIGGIYINTPTPCDTAQLVSLPIWLIVYGAIAIATSFTMVVVTKKSDGTVTKRKQGADCLTGCFFFAWNVVGALALFRYAPTCETEAYSLWASTLAILIIQWIATGLVFILAILTIILACIAAR